MEKHDGSWWFAHGAELPFRLWAVLRDMRSSVSTVLERYFGDDEAIKIALAANLPYWSDDPDQIARADRFRSLEIGVLDPPYALNYRGAMTVEVSADGQRFTTVQEAEVPNDPGKALHVTLPVEPFRILRVQI